MSRLPTPGSDNGSWGNILNDFLLQAHDSDGSIKDGAISEANLDASVQTKLNASGGSVASTDITDSTATGRSLLTAANAAAAKTTLGIGNVDNTSDATKNSAAVTLTNKTISGASNTLTNIPAGEVLVDNLTVPVIESTSTLTVTTSAAANVPVPTGVEADDIVIIVIYMETATAPTPPAGFIESTGSPASVSTYRQRTFWKRATGNDAGTYNFSWGSPTYRLGIALRVSGCIDTGDPFNVEDADSGVGSMPTLSMTTTEDDTLIVWAGSNWNSGGTTVPSGYADVVTYAPPSESSMAVASLFQSTAGPTGSVTGTAAGGNEKMAWMGALKSNTTGTTPLDDALTDKVSLTGSETLTNKRITRRVGTTVSSATPTINTNAVDMYVLTAQAADITSFTTNLSGTPTDGQTLWIAITGTASRAITWGASFESSTVILPTTTVSTNRLDIGFIWNSATSKWRCIAAV